MRMKHPQPFSVQTQEICYDLTVKIQNDSMRLLDHTEERPDIENWEDSGSTLLRPHTPTVQDGFSMEIYTYGMHTNFRTQSNLAHIHI